MGELETPFAPGGRAPVSLLIGGNCAGLPECEGSLGDSHIRLVGAVVDMVNEIARHRRLGSCCVSG